VAHILEGSVRKAGDRIRITAQLIEGRTDTHLWSETYDRTLDDVLAIQDEIAAAIVDQLRLTLLGELPGTDRIDPDAYLLYLQGDYYVNYVDSEKAVDRFLKAVEIEPGFVDAWLGLNRAYYQLSSTQSMPKGGEKDEYHRLSDEAWPGPGAGFLIAELYAVLGETDMAFNWLEIGE